MITGPSTAETFTEDERRRLAPYFTNLDGHVFALTNKVGEVRREPAAFVLGEGFGSAGTGNHGRILPPAPAS